MRPAVDDPAAVARLFEKFVLAGYASAKFTEPLYEDLRNSFGFIAHYDRAGFYAARFADAGARVDTLTIMSDLTEWFSKQPLETSLRAVVEKHGLFGAAIRERDTEIERVERAELARLRAKYESAPITTRR